MSSTSAIGGSAGTFDATTTIAALVAAVKAPQAALNNKITNINTQISSLGSLITQVQALGTAVGTLNSTSKSQALGVASNNTNVGASITGDAQAGTYSLSVAQLATAQTSTSSTFASNTAGVAGSGSLTLQTATGSPISVAFTASDTLTNIADKINAQAGSIAHASVLFDGSTYRIVVNSAQTGSAGALQFTDSSDSGLNLSSSSSTIVNAQDAKMTLNGIAVTRSSNVVGDVLPGVTLTLTATTPVGSPATVTVATDAEAVNTQVSSFVTAFNTLVGTVNTATTYSGAQLGEGSLFGDTAVRGLRSELGTTLSAGVVGPDGKTHTLDEVGITLNKDGTLTLDSSKLSSAVASDPSIVSKLFVGVSTTGSKTTGLAATLSDLVDRYSGGSGQLTTEKTQRSQSISDIQDKITAIDTRADQVQTLLQNQFAKLDAVQAQWSSQQTYITNLTKANQSS